MLSTSGTRHASSSARWRGSVVAAPWASEWVRSSYQALSPAFAIVSTAVRQGFAAYPYILARQHDSRGIEAEGRAAVVAAGWLSKFRGRKDFRVQGLRFVRVGLLALSSAPVDHSPSMIATCGVAPTAASNSRIA